MGSASGKNSYSREAYHAGSWYDDAGVNLNNKLQNFLDATAGDTSCGEPNRSTSPHPSRRVRALICPHAGYSYSGPTAAYAYAALQRELRRGSDGQSSSTPIKSILVLHPSHHVYLEGCAVSGASVLETPAGSLAVDDDLRQEILSLSRRFTSMDKRMDEEEHSGEMQYPFLAKILVDTGRLDEVKVLPIMCGNLSVSAEEFFGNLLAPVIARPDVLTVVSTDFCHWGKRFSYQPMPSSKSSPGVPIHEFIESMDRRGMGLIQSQQPGAFADYLRETRNTICGRHAVAVWMRAVHAKKDASSPVNVEFVRYAQSSPAKSVRDSSVSYAAAVATATE